MPALPLQNLRDEADRLDHERLMPGAEWPNNVPPPLPVQTPLLAGKCFFAANRAPRGPRAIQRALSGACAHKIVWRTGSGWSPWRWAQPRVLCVYQEEDDEKSEEPIVTVEAAEGDSQTFFTLFQMCQLDGAYEHVRDWPGFWNEPADVASTWECADGAKGAAHAGCRCMPLVSLAIGLEASQTASTPATVAISVILEAGAFELDRRLAAGCDGGGWADADEYESALQGDRPNVQRDLQKALRRLLLGMVQRADASGLRLGPDSSQATMNGYAGVTEAEVTGATTATASSEAGAAPTPPSTADFDLGALLESVSTHEGDASASPHGAPPLPAAALAGLNESTRLHPFQERGIAWMVHKEAAPDRLSLHPAWLQLATPAHHGRSAQLLYVHTSTGELSSRFFTAPRLETCGGMLCDDVGLGKSVQLLGLTLARPAPAGWAVDELPLRSSEVVPIKATLLIAPAALLTQWAEEVAKHTKEGALTCCTYLGLGAARKAAAAARAGGEGAAEPEVAAEDDGEAAGRSRRSRRRVPVVEAAAAAAGPAAGPAAGREEDAADGVEYELMARTQRHLFAPLPGHQGAAPRVEQCDLVLCSFETLRDELRKTQGLTAGKDLPLGTLGFWRIILDEAQLVSQSTSKAALMCSELWRRHAWVATGTPINAKAQELQGLLAFLGTAPFREDFVFNALLLSGYKEREPSALYRMRTLLRALCLRRSKHDPAVQAQIALPPMEWRTRTLTLSAGERSRYQLAVDVLRRSHRAYARASSGRVRSGFKSRLLGQLNGDLTRVRQTVCHPSVVNADRPRVGQGGRSGGGDGGLVGGLDGARLPHETVLRRLIARAAAQRLSAAVANLRARCMLHVTQRSVGVAVGTRENMALEGAWPAVRDELAQHEKTVRAEIGSETDADAARVLEAALAKLPKLRAELRELLEEDDEPAASEATYALAATVARAGSKRRRTEGAADDDERKSEGKGKGKGKGKAAAAASSGSDAVVSVLVGDAAKAVAKATATARDKLSTHAYLCSLLPQRAAAQGTTAEDNEGDGDDARDDADDADYVEEEAEAAAETPAAGGEEEEEQCPVCLDSRSEGASWSITACGHSGCYECMAAAIAERSQCPCCKQRLTIEGLYEVAPAAPAAMDVEATVASTAAASAALSAAAASAVDADAATSEAAAVSEYGSKVTALCRELAAVHAEGGKAVVFSAWTRLLSLAMEALEAFGIPCASLVGSLSAKREALAAFASPKAAVLLVPLFGGASGAGGGGAAGLTLTQARVAVLLEPALQPGIERQAAGRISRIGQTGACTCLRLIVDETIESKILSWQQIRLADGASANPTLTLNDFAALAE